MGGVYIAKNGFLAVFPLFGKTQKPPFLRNSDPDRPHTHNWSFFLVIRTIRPSFVKFGPKLRVLPYTGRNGQKWPFFGPEATKTAITRERKVKKLSEGAKMTATARATNGPLTKFAVPYQKMDFRAENRKFWPKKSVFFYATPT